MKLYQNHSALSDLQTQLRWCVLYGIPFNNHSQNSASACMADKVCCHGNTAVSMLASYSVLPRAIWSVDLYIFEVLQSLVSVITEKLPLFFTTEIEISSCIHLHIFKFEKCGSLTFLNTLWLWVLVSSILSLMIWQNMRIRSIYSHGLGGGGQNESSSVISICI